MSLRRLRSALKASTTPLDPVTAGWYVEYKYRRIMPGLSHEQYLDEPGDAIQWMTRIHQIVTEIEREAEAR